MVRLFRVQEGPLRGHHVLHPANVDAVGNFTTLDAAKDAAEELHGPLRWNEMELSDEVTIWQARLAANHAVEIEVVTPIHKIGVTARTL